MNKIKLLLFFLSISLLLTAQENKYQIEGTSDAKFEGKTILLLTFEDDEFDSRELRSVESQIVENRKFAFQGSEHCENLSYLIFDNLLLYSDAPEGNGKSTEILLEKGNIAVHLNGDTAILVKGTPLNEILQSYNNQRNTSETRKVADLIKENIDNVLSKLIFRDAAYDFDKLTDVELNEIFALAGDYFKLDERVEMYKQGREIVKSIQSEDSVRKGLMGAKYKDFDFITATGQSQKLSDYVGKSKYLVIDFWASWCAPCIASVPHFKELYEKYKHKGVEFLGVSLDTEDAKQSWLKAVKRIDTPWKQVSDLKGYGDFSKFYGVSDVPYVILIDEQGTIMEHIRLPDRFLEISLERLP